MSCLYYFINKKAYSCGTDYKGEIIWRNLLEKNEYGGYKIIEKPDFDENNALIIEEICKQRGQSRRYGDYIYNYKIIINQDKKNIINKDAVVRFIKKYIDDNVEGRLKGDTWYLGKGTIYEKIENNLKIFEYTASEPYLD